MKKIFIRIIALLLVILTVASFAACSPEKKPDTTPDPTPDEENPGDENPGDDPSQGGDDIENITDTRKEVSVREMLQTLAASPYSANIKPD
jgi:hypothetical protein